MHRWLALLLLFIFPFQSFSAQAQLPSSTVSVVLSLDATTDAHNNGVQNLSLQDLNEFLDHCEAPPGTALPYLQQATKRSLCSYLSQVQQYQHLPERRPPKNGWTTQHVTTSYFYS